MTQNNHNPTSIAQALEALVKDYREYMPDLLERVGADDPDTYPVGAEPRTNAADSSAEIVIEDNHENLYLMKVEPYIS